MSDDIELDPDDHDLFDQHRNPHQSIRVAALAWIIDRRPVLLYEEGSMPDEFQAVAEQSLQEAESVRRRMGQAKNKKNLEAGDKKLCVRCKERPIAGNRTGVCHHCSRVDWEGEPGKGGRQAAALETRFQIEREELKRRNAEALRAARKQHRAEVARLRSTLSAAQVTAESNQKDSVVLMLLEQLCSEDPEGEFAKAFQQKLEVARAMAARGWTPPE